MPKRRFDRPAPPDEENHGVYDPDDYDNGISDTGGDNELRELGNQGKYSEADRYGDDDLADREQNPDDYDDNSVSDSGDDSELRKLSSENQGKYREKDLAKNQPGMYNANGDKKSVGDMAAGAAARELGPAGTAAKKLVEMFGKGKNGRARGGIAGAVLAIAMIGGFAGINNYANHFLNHVTEVFDKEVAKVAKHEEQKVARSLMQRMVDRAMKRASASEEEKVKMDEEEEKAKAENRAVAEATEAGILSKSPTLQQLLKDAGLELRFNANGELDAILDKTGKDVGEQLAKEAPSTQALIEQEWDISKLYNQRTNFTFHGGTSLNIFPEDGSQDKNPKKTVAQAIHDGAAAEQIAMAEATQEKNIPEGADEATRNSINELEQKAKLIKDVTDAADKEFKTSYDAETAKEVGVKAGLKSINKLGNSLSLAGIATTACTVKESFQVAADRRVPKLITLLMRNYGTLKSLASELNAGRLTSRTVNQTALLYFGNKGLFPNKDGTPKEASFPVTRSAAWHRASKVTVDSNPKSPYYTPDITPGMTPTKSGPTRFVDRIQKILNATGLELACDTLTSKAGLIAQTGLTAIQVVANIGTFGAAQAALLAGGVAFNIALETEILPAIPDLFSNLGGTGTNSAVANGNNDEVGGNLAWKDYGRSTLGAIPVSDATAKQANDVADADQLREKQSQSLAYRTFATSNADSLLSRLIMRIPLDTQASIASMGSYFANFPFTIMHTLSTVFAPPSLQAASNTGCKSDPHCITGYVLTDTMIDRYGNKQTNGGKSTAYLDNENYLFGTVSYDGKSVKRIDALGNPNTYKASPEGDSNNDDLLHCFVNSHEQLAPMSDGSNDATRENCGSMGSYDATSEPPVAPNNHTVAGIYCKALGSNKYDTRCMDAVNNQISDDFNRYCVYQAFATVARTYTYASTITDE